MLVISSALLRLSSLFTGSHHTNRKWWAFSICESLGYATPFWVLLLVLLKSFCLSLRSLASWFVLGFVAFQEVRWDRKGGSRQLRHWLWKARCHCRRHRPEQSMFDFMHIHSFVNRENRGKKENVMFVCGGRKKMLLLIGLCSKKGTDVRFCKYWKKNWVF